MLLMLSRIVVAVTELPNAVTAPPIVIEFAARYALAIGEPFHTPVVTVPSEVKEELTTFAASVVPVSVPAGATTAEVDAAVIRPFALTVNEGMALDEPNAPTLLFTVARVPAAVTLLEPLNAGEV